MFRLDGHKALVTGGTQGVGAAMAVAIAAAGADVLIHGLRYDEAAESTLRAIRDLGRATDFVEGDLSQHPNEIIDSLYLAAQAKLNGIDLLINNAGTYREPSFLEADVDCCERTMRINVYSGLFLTQRFARAWVQRNVAGRVLFTSSINGLLSEPNHVFYDASKGAVSAMVRSLAVSLAPKNIRVNAIAPGLVRTPLTNSVLSQDPAVLAWMKLHTPNGEVPEPDVCGPAAVFLLSDEARHIQGQTIYVDGGMSIWQQPDLPENLRPCVGM